MIAGAWTVCVFILFYWWMRKKKAVFFHSSFVDWRGFFVCDSPSYFQISFLYSIYEFITCIRRTKKWQKIILFSGFTALSFIYLFYPTFHREDWKSLARDVVKYNKIYMIYSSSDPIKYYNSDIIVKDLNKLRTATDKNHSYPLLCRYLGRGLSVYAQK